MDDERERFLRAKTLEEAEAIQRDLARRVVLRPLERPPRTVAAVDADYAGPLAFAAAVLFSYGCCDTPIEKRSAVGTTEFPYVPGYLSFREAPAALDALGKLSRLPDLVLVDGQGIAPPRRFGIACHIGVLTGLPTIGCAKTRLVGDFREPGLQRGEWSPLELDGEVVGAVLRTRTGVKPLYVSPGHLVMLEDAIEIVLHCSAAYRIPGPLRIADQVAKATRRKMLVA